MFAKATTIMTREVVSARPDDTVSRIARMLCDHDISAVPVCDEGGHLLGIVSEGDLMRPFAKNNLLKRAWWLNVLAEGGDLAPAFLDYIRQDNRRARDLMTTPVITATEATTLPELAELMGVHRVKRVPILSEGRMVGIVSRADVVRALAYLQEEVIETV